ncbi:MAG: type II toxin-antitoxin system HicB family antitoxin [Clostridia bacterium]|nr:type II toxin-antitoxin system HicB family antitoxin [Clostridia bacterium]
MKTAYPVVLSKGEKYIVAFVPDFNINSQGKDYAEVIEMVRDAIGIMGIDMEDSEEELPIPSDIIKVIEEHNEDLVTLVDVDFEEYRRKNELKTVRRNVSLPSWLNVEAERAGINVSAILQMALMKELKLEKK